MNSSSRFFLSTKFKFVSDQEVLACFRDIHDFGEGKLTLSFVDEDWLASALLSETGSVRLKGSFRCAESCVGCLVRVGATFEVELAGEVRANGL